METAHRSSISPKGWRFQFGLRGLMLLLILSGLGLGGWRYWEKTQPQRELSAAIYDCPVLSDEEKDILSAIVWKAATTSSEFVPQPDDPWLQGVWEPVATLSLGVIEPFEPRNRSLRFEKNRATFLTAGVEDYLPNWSVAQCNYSRLNGQRMVKLNWKEKDHGVYCLYDGRENIMLAHICPPFYKVIETGIEYDIFDRPNPYPMSFLGADRENTFLIIFRRIEDRKGSQSTSISASRGKIGPGH